MFNLCFLLTHRMPTVLVSFSSKGSLGACIFGFILILKVPIVWIKFSYTETEDWGIKSLHKFLNATIKCRDCGQVSSRALCSPATQDWHLKLQHWPTFINLFKVQNNLVTLARDRYWPFSIWSSIWKHPAHSYVGTAQMTLHMRWTQ